jgi:hypothetical protein
MFICRKSFIFKGLRFLSTLFGFGGYIVVVFLRRF